MTSKPKILTIFGTRPEAIKMAPVVNELIRHGTLIESYVAVTAQHREMLDQVLKTFSIVPDYDLNLMQSGQSLTDITARALTGIDAIIKKVGPDLVLVHGDTTTTFSSSLAAFYNQVKIGHIEAGLRTNNRHSPFPEEINRQMTGLLADFHFAPTKTAVNNLLKENKNPLTIHLTGNTVIDALKTTINHNYHHDLLLSNSNRKLILLTVHRRENLGDPMRRIFKAVRRLADDFEDIAFVCPLHFNPAIREIAKDLLLSHPRIFMIEPLDVVDFHNFAARSFCILTDSGGIQEEASFLGVPVLILRDTTERPEGVEAGNLLLVGTGDTEIYSLTKELLSNEDLYKNMAVPSTVFGDGNSSKRIVDAILRHFDIP